jgi:hypothetical protein
MFPKLWGTRRPPIPELLCPEAPDSRIEDTGHLAENLDLLPEVRFLAASSAGLLRQPEQIRRVKPVQRSSPGSGNILGKIRIAGVLKFFGAVPAQDCVVVFFKELGVAQHAGPFRNGAAILWNLGLLRFSSRFSSP